jgi:cell division protein FtsL
MNRAVVILIFALMCCSLALVYSQQKTRMLYAEKNRLEIKELRLNEDWRRLQYDQRDLSKPSRIVDIASKQLHMRDPKQDKSVYVKELKDENK